MSLTKINVVSYMTNDYAKKAYIVAYEREPDGYVRSYYTDKKIRPCLLKDATIGSLREGVGLVKNFIKNNGYKIKKGSIRKGEYYSYELEKIR